VDLNVVEWTPEKKGPLAVLLVPGTGSHVAYYSRFARALTGLGLHAFGVDLKGHGASGGERGVFTMREMVQNAVDAARFIRERTGLPVGVVGTSQGGEVAFHVLQSSDDVKAAVCHNILLSTLFPLNARMRLIMSPVVGLAARVLPRFPIPLQVAVNWKKAYVDPTILEEKKRDPLAVWTYALASYRSVFTTPSPVPPAANQKPVMVACGERDEIVPPAHCLKCFSALGGPKEFYVMPGAAHQLVVDYSEPFARVVRDFFLRHLPAPGM
jgi:alpha-beta hydrolase superfamily lysophospholipase